MLRSLLYRARGALSTCTLDPVVNYTGPRDRYQRVRVTHPFHPLHGREFGFVEHRQNWGEDRVYLRDEDGELFSVLAGWTDVVPADPFTVIADGRCPFTAECLLALADLIGRLRSRPGSGGACQADFAANVRRITPGLFPGHAPPGCSAHGILRCFLKNFSRYCGVSSCDGRSVPAKSA
jgi:Family of unknown function (DUF5372)